MLKRITVYLEESEVETLRRISLIKNVSIADLIRREVQRTCKALSYEQKGALSILAEIKTDAKKVGLTTNVAMGNTLKMQKTVRRIRKIALNKK